MQKGEAAYFLELLQLGCQLSLRYVQQYTRL
jgi:hypothetical protein